MISARFKSENKAKVPDMTHVEAGDCFIKIIDANTLAHLIVDEVVSVQRFIMRFLDENGARTGSSFPMTASELSKLHPNVPANGVSVHPRAVNG